MFLSCLYLPNTAINFHSFWYGNYPSGLLWENHSVYARKILRWPKFGYLWPKFGHFLAKIDSYESFLWKLFLWSSLRKLYFICWENSDMAEFWPFKTKIWHFCQNLQIWEFLTYNFQMPRWLFLIFGMEVVLIVFF